jgi:hypothetical protein
MTQVSEETGQDSHLPNVSLANNSGKGVLADRTPECEPFCVRDRRSPQEPLRAAFRDR